MERHGSELTKSHSSNVNELCTTYKIYSEDDYFEGESSKYYQPSCDLTVQKVPAPFQFDYLRFTYYLKIKEEVEAINKIIDISKGLTSPDIIQEAYNDKVLSKELINIYGEMDEKSERFKKIFKNYKIQRLEQIQAWSTIERNDFNEYLNEENELEKHFSPHEIKMFKSERNLPFLIPINTEKSTLNRTQNHYNIHNQHRNEVVKVLQKYPLGVDIRCLIDECNTRLYKGGYRGPAVTDKTIMKINHLEDLFTRQKYNKNYLIFPKTCNIFRNPCYLEWNFRHWLVAILNLSGGIISVAESVQQMYQMNCHNFNPRNWGYESDTEFVVHLLNKWKTSAEVVELNFSKESNYYLAVMTKQSKKLIETAKIKKTIGSSKDNLSRSTPICKNVNKPKAANKEPSSKLEKPKPTTSSSSYGPWNGSPHPISLLSNNLNQNSPSSAVISSNFTQIGDKISQEQNDIKIGSQYDCVVTLVNSPTNFYLVHTVKWKTLDRLFNELRKYWVSNSAITSPPQPNFLQKNYICMAKTNSDEEIEVYRVVILGKSSPNHYQAYCIDYGDILSCTLEQLRYLPRAFLYSMDAQAISCALYNVASPKKDTKTGNDIWNQDVCDFTQSVFLPEGCDTPLVKVHFKQRIGGNGKWLVKVSTKPNGSDLGEDIMKFVNEDKKS